MRYVVFSAALAVGACQSAASDTVTCGPGTVLSGNECVPAPAADAGTEAPLDGGSDSAGEGGASEAGSDSVDAGPPIHTGDPCDPLAQNGACYGKLAFTCSPLQLDAGVFEPLDDCSLMGGECVPARAGVAGAFCTGGGYTSCDPTKDLGHCFSPGVLAKCKSEGFYKSQNCAAYNTTCVETDAGARCE